MRGSGAIRLSETGLKVGDRTLEECAQAWSALAALADATPFQAHPMGRSVNAPPWTCRRGLADRTRRRAEALGSLDVKSERISRELFDEMIRVEGESWKSEHGSAYLRRPQEREFLRDVLIESGTPHELWTCRIDGALASFADVLPNRRTCDHCLSSFRKRFAHPGAHLLCEIIRDTFESPRCEFDFLQGDQPYKRSWASHQKKALQVAAAGHGGLGRVALADLSSHWRLARSSRLRQLDSPKVVTRLRHGRIVSGAAEDPL